MACIAATYSRMRAAGSDHGMLKRRVMWGLMRDASPRLKRPPPISCRSHPSWAVVIGLRANATAMLVPNVSRRVRAAASASPRNGSWILSLIQTPSQPAASSSSARCAARVGSEPIWASIRMEVLVELVAAGPQRPTAAIARAPVYPE